VHCTKLRLDSVHDSRLAKDRIIPILSMVLEPVSSFKENKAIVVPCNGIRGTIYKLLTYG